MNDVNLNLSRKWRSKNFDQIVGQDLSVRMLKNSLYLDQYFPVYLFSGQRGCGKTSTARIFAAAINCDQLENFRKNPKTSSVPCLKCDSCKAMLSGKHSDFIEIDAASHTGVDNVRQIIDASQLLPLMGRKKIYLIDEAHMLSKAAFNAFLKILEEPPSSVLFILATTDPQKILDTVKSRCFQLFFRAVKRDPLFSHLKNVCDTEKISYKDSAFDLIIKETEGSVRDALNLIEQVRFAHGSVTKDSVLSVLGHIDDEQMLSLFFVLLNEKPKKMLSFLKEMTFSLISAEFTWGKLIEIVRAALWLKYDVKSELFERYTDQIKLAIENSSVERLNNILKCFYENEILFLKTISKHSLLEMILLQICQKNKKIVGSSGSSPISQNVATPFFGEECDDLEDDDEEIEEEVKGVEKQNIVNVLKDDSKNIDCELEKKWSIFLQSLNNLNDPLLCSVFKNGALMSLDSSNNILSVAFSKQFSLFKETINDTKKLWLPLLKESFGESISFSSHFTVENIVKEDVLKKKDKEDLVNINDFNLGQKKQSGSGFSNLGMGGQQNRQKITKSYSKTIYKRADLSDFEVWKKANMINKYFSGSFSEIIEA